MAASTTEYDRARVLFLRALAFTYYKGLDYSEAKDILDVIKATTKSEDLDCLLVRAECDHYQELGYESTEQFYDLVVKSEALTYKDLIDWSNKLHESGRFLGAILLTNAAKKKYMKENAKRNPVAMLGEIAFVIGRRGKFLAHAGAQPESICHDFVIKHVLKEIKDEIANTACASKDEKALAEVRCIQGLGSCAISNDDVITASERGIELVKSLEMDQGRYRSWYGIAKDLSELYVASTEMLGITEKISRYEKAANILEEVFDAIDKLEFLDDITKLEHKQKLGKQILLLQDQRTQLMRKQHMQRSTEAKPALLPKTRS